MAARKIRLISPQVLSAGMKYENWIFIAVYNPAGSEKPTRKSQTPIEGNPVSDGIGPIHNSFPVDEKTFISKIKEILSKHKEKDFLSLILWDEKESRYPDIEKQLQTAGITNVFYLEGGLGAYRSFESRQNNPSQANHFGTRGNGLPQCPSCR